MVKTVRLGVLADTHLTSIGQASGLVQALLDGPFAGVDIVLHCGDMVLPEFDTLFGARRFYAVRGNMDPSQPGLPFKRILSLGDYRLGMVHGWGPAAEVPAKVYREFAGQSLDLILFGHSHTPCLEQRDKTLLFNPGSATEHRGRHPFCTVGRIELGERIKAEHVRFEFTPQI